jgi:hypothetical protein
MPLTWQYMIGLENRLNAFTAARSHSIFLGIVNNGSRPSRHWQIVYPNA